MTRSTFYSLIVSVTILAGQSTFAQADEKMINETMDGSVSTVDGYVPSMSITKDGKAVTIVNDEHDLFSFKLPNADRFMNATLRCVF